MAEKTSTSNNKPKWGMVMDTRRCIGCHACHVACKAENKVPQGVFRTHVKYYEKGEYPKPKRFFLNAICMHCEDPPCVPVCPVNATFKREDGIVLVNYEKCIGCGYCVNACPFDARYITPTHVGDIRSGKADKCTFCAHRLDVGVEPACVSTCVGGTRIFGDFNDPDSKVSKLKKAALDGKLNGATHYGEKILEKGLSVFYIFPEEAKNYHVPDVRWPRSERTLLNSVKPAGVAAAGVTAAIIASSAVAGAFDKDPAKEEKNVSR